MGWIIAIIIVILIAASGDKNKNVSSAKSGQIDPYVKGLVDKYISLRSGPTPPEVESQLNDVVEDLIDEFLYCYKHPQYSRERTAIIMALCEHSFRYGGAKYPQFRGKSTDDIINELINDPRYRR